MAECATRHRTASQTQWPVRVCRCQKNVPTKNLDRKNCSDIAPSSVRHNFNTRELNEEPTNEMNEKQNVQNFI